MGGGSQTNDSSNTYTPNATAMSGFTNVMQGANAIANQNRNWNPAMGVNVADFNNQQQQAFSGIGGLQNQYLGSFNDALGMAREAGQNINGQDINQFMNPYTQNVIDTTMANTTRQQGAALQGVVGNQIAQNAQGGDRAMLQKALTEGEFARQNNATIAGLESAGYNSALSAAEAQKGLKLQGAYGLSNMGQAAQNYRLQGLQALMGSGAAQQGLEQERLNAATKNATSQTMWPMQLQQWLAGITGGMGSLMGGTTTGTTKTEEHPGFFNYLGMGMGGMSAMSDERVKENKKVVGELFDGQKVYSFNYKGSPATQLGLMAQEVERHHPESVGETSGGVKTVQYDMATHDAAKRGNFADGGMPGFGGSGDDPWGSLLQGSQQFHPATQPGQAPKGDMSLLDKSKKEGKEQIKTGQQAGKNAKDVWNKYLNGKGDQAPTKAEGWKADVEPSDSGATSSLTTETTEVPVGESATGFADLGGSGGAAAAEGAGTAGAGAAEAGTAAAAGAGEAAAGTGAAAAEGAGAAAAGTGETAATAGGGLIELIASMFSDERMKENKRVVGRTYDGQNIYAFNYKGHPVTQLGLMAQEVEHRHPGAVGEVGGAKTVHYGAATHDAAKRGHFADGGLVSLGRSYTPWSGGVRELPQSGSDRVGLFSSPQLTSSFNENPNSSLHLAPNDDPNRKLTSSPNLGSTTPLGSSSGKGSMSQTGGGGQIGASSQGGQNGQGVDIFGALRSIFGFADGGDVSSAGEMEKHARKLLNLAGGGEAADPDEEPFINSDDFAYETIKAKPPITGAYTPDAAAGVAPNLGEPHEHSDVIEGMHRAPHEKRTHFDPYGGKSPAESHKLPGQTERSPWLQPAGREALTGDAATARGIVTNDLFNVPPAWAEPKSHLGDVKHMEPIAGIDKSLTPAEIKMPPLAGQNITPEVRRWPNDFAPKPYMEGTQGERVTPAMPALEGRQPGAEQQTGGLRMPTRADIAELLQSARGAGSMLKDQFAPDTDLGMALRAAKPGAERALKGLEMESASDRMERQQSEDEGGEFRFNRDRGRVEFISSKQLEAERLNRAQTPVQGVQGEPVAPGTPQTVAAQPGIEKTPPTPERKAADIMSMPDAEWDAMSPADKFRLVKQREPTAAEVEDIMNISKNEAAREAAQTADAERLAKLKRYSDFAQNAVRLNGPAVEKSVPPVGGEGETPPTPEQRGRVPFSMRHAAALPDLAGKKIGEDWGAPEGFKSPIDIDRENVLKELHKVARNFGPEGYVKNTPKLGPDLEPNLAGPEGYLKSELGLEPVTPTSVKAHELSNSEKLNALEQQLKTEQQPFTEGTAPWSGPNPNAASKTVPTETAPAPTKTFKVSPFTGERMAEEAPKAEPYAGGVGAPKAGNAAEEIPSRYGAGARISMTRRLNFENDLGGVTKDTNDDPSMGHYGILAKRGGSSSASDFYDDHGAELGFDHDPRRDPWGFAADWRRIAKENPKGLEAAEEAWHNKYIKGSVRAHIVHAGLPGSVAEDERVQDYFEDRYVQHGTGISKNPNGRNGANRIKRSWEGSEGDIPTFLKNMSDEDRAHVRHDFETYLTKHPDHQPGLEDRIKNRLAGALGEKVQPGGKSEQVTEAAEKRKSAEEAAPKSTADLLPQEQNQVNFIKKILGGWNPLEGITGPGKEGKDSWNPLGLTSDQRRNLMMVGLSMAGGSPLGMRALAGGAEGMMRGQQMEMNEQSMGVQRAKLALEAMNQPKFSAVHWTDFMGMQHAGSMDVHSGAITEAGQTAPTSGPGAPVPGSIQPTAPREGGVAPTGEPRVDQMFQQYPGSRDTTESLLEGRMTLQQIPTRQRPAFEEAANAVARSRGQVYDPVKIQKQSDFEKDFLKEGSKSALQVESLNRSSDHINSMMGLSEQLGENTGARDYVSGKLADNFTPMRDPIRERYRFLGRGLASELAKLESGGKGAQKTTEEWESAFDPSLPRAVRDANIMEAFELMRGNIKGLDQKWINGARKGKNGPVIDYMAPETRRNMDTAQLRYEQATGKTPTGERSTVTRPPAPIPVIREQLKVALKAAKTPEGRQAILERAKGWGVYGLEAQP